jgi:hypothetical protein
MFLWRIASHLLPTKDNLDKFLHFEDRYCPLCELEQESIIHLFLHCTVAKALWFGSSRGIKSESLPICHGANLVSYILNPLVLFLSNIEVRKRFSLFGALILDGIWKLRNQVVFEKRVLPLRIS